MNWQPIEQLKEYAGKELHFITIKGKDLDSGNEFEKNLYGDILEVDDDGTINFSDFQMGNIFYNEKENCYEHWLWQRKRRYNITEFCDIVLWR